MAGAQAVRGQGVGEGGGPGEPQASSLGTAYAPGTVLDTMWLSPLALRSTPPEMVELTLATSCR